MRERMCCYIIQTARAMQKSYVSICSGNIYFPNSQFKTAGLRLDMTYEQVEY